MRLDLWSWLATCVAVLSPLATAQVPGDPFAMARVGSEVDTAERAYFLLLPSFEGTDPLRLTWAGPDSVRVEAASGERLMLSVRQARTLDATLAQYEGLFDAPTPPVDVGALARLIRWRRPTADQYPVVVTLRDREVGAWILYATASGLVVSPDPPRQIPRAEDLLWVPADELVRVHTTGFRSDLDVRVGGDPVRYRAALADLAGAAVFVRGLPPELRGWVRALPSPDETRPPDERFAGVPLSRWQIGVAVEAGVIDAGTTTTDPFGQAPPIEDSWAGRTKGTSLRIGYNVTSRLGTEAVGRFRASERMEGLVLNQRRYTAASVDLVGAYAVVPPTLGGFSVTGRLGVSVLQAWASTEMSYASSGGTLAGEIETTERLPLRPGGLAGVGLSYRPVRGVSLGADLDWAVYPDVEEDELVLPDRGTGLALKTVAARSVAVQFGGVAFGVTFHLGHP